jgi:hypothetical protein
METSSCFTVIASTTVPGGVVGAGEGVRVGGSGVGVGRESGADIVGALDGGDSGRQARTKNMFIATKKNTRRTRTGFFK